MGKSKKKKTSLKFSVLLLLITAALLVSSSYAWFTSNKSVAVSALDVSVEAKNGLQISTDGTTWKSKIQTTDITTAHAQYVVDGNSVNQLPASLEPVSTCGDVDANGFLNMFYGDVKTNTNGDYILTATKETDTRGTTGKYIAFDLFFKVQQPTDIELNPNSKVIFKDANSKGLENAARVAFLVEGNMVESSALGDVQAMKGATNAVRYIWEPNFDTHTAAAVTHAFQTYAITANATRTPYSGIKAAIAHGDDLLVGTVKGNDGAETPRYAETPIAYDTTNGYTTPEPIFSLAAGVTKVRVYMWVEGQDVDCENNASGANVEFTLQVDVTTPQP